VRLLPITLLLIFGDLSTFFGESSATTFLAFPVLGERPTRARWLSALGGFVGILILVRPGGAVFHPATALLLMAAVANALYQLLTRKLGGDASHTTLFYSGLVGTVMLSAALPFVDTPSVITFSDVFFLVLLGLLAGVGHWGLIIAFTRAPATLVAPFTYVGMVWATLYGLAVFGHLPDTWSFVGMGVIVASGVGLMAHERRRSAPAGAHGSGTSPGSRCRRRADRTPACSR